VAFALLWRFANPLSAWLALSGLLFYVFIYTLWLKRVSPQNIVIGGAAGAFPPLVGWAAVTGEIGLASLYLFAIIFYWTPPHFWALALIKREEYARAGIPMMPVVQGAHRTKVQMLAYSIMLVPLTVLPWLSGTQGARLIWYCVRLLREPVATALAWRMYQYSLAYLALLFVAMGADRLLPFGHLQKPVELVLVRSPAEHHQASDH
jgi:protoheme IX farnesyltransferase